MAKIESQLEIDMSRLTDLERKSIQKILLDLQKSTKLFYKERFEQISRIKRKCMIEGCENYAQDCHLIQNSRYLKNLIEKNQVNNTLYKIMPESIFKYNTSTNNAPLMDVKSVSINKAICFKILCNEHDNKIFEPIEKFEPDFNEYNTALLMTYRTLLSELRAHLDKKELFVSDINDNKAKLNQIKKKYPHPISNIMEKHYFSHNDNNLTKKIIEVEYTINKISKLRQQIEDDLTNKNKEQFNFQVRVINKLPIAVCSLVSSEYQTTEAYTKNPYIFISIPDKDKSIMIFGYNKNYTDEWITETVKKWQHCSENELQLSCSTILLLRCENWVSSQYFYNNLSDEFKTIIKKAHSSYLNNLILLKGEINLFKQSFTKRVIV